MKIDLPGGHHAVLRAPEAVTERQRRPLVRAMRGVRPEIVERQGQIAEMPDLPDGKPTEEKRRALAQLQYDMTNEEADAYQDAGDLAAVALIESWSFPHEVSLDGILELPAQALDTLRVKVAPEVSKLFLNTEVSPAKASPFGSSNGSAAISPEGQQTTSLASGAPTAASASG